MRKPFRLPLFFTVLTASLLYSFTQRPTRIVFFGDSITELAVHPPGYIVQISDSLRARQRDTLFELIGSGIGGNKVYDLFFRLEPDVLARRPDRVFIFVGINDVWHKQLAHTGTDAPKFRQFYAGLIEKMQAAGIDVALCTPPCIGERPNGANELDLELDAYADIVRDLARQYNCRLCDLRAAFQQYQQEHNRDDRPSGVLTTDGVHLNEAGNRLVAQVLLREI
jgi:lysophospholipase L1-like esterase